MSYQCSYLELLTLTDNADLGPGESQPQVMEHPATESQCLEQPATEPRCLKYPTIESQCLEHPTIESQCLEHPATESQCLEHPATESQCLEHPATESNPASLQFSSYVHISYFSPINCKVIRPHKGIYQSVS